MIGKDGLSLVINDSGSRYNGPPCTLYSIDGNVHIPVKFKSSLSLGDLELLFSTQMGTDSPEYQITLRSKAGSTILSWTSDLKSLQDKLIALLNANNVPNLNPFKGNLLDLFGITDAAVQKFIRAEPKQARLDGVLYCETGTNPTSQDYENYLGMVADYDTDYAWIADEFRREKLPANWYQYASEGKIYWVNSATQLNTWKHPMYDKYRKMLVQARIERPSNSIRSITTFQIEFHFSRDRNSEVSEILELARIFKINLDAEPFLVHIIRRALPFFEKMVDQKKSLTSAVADFNTLVDRARRLVKDLERMRDLEISNVSEILQCVECKGAALIHCEHCEDIFCQKCFENVHKHGKRKLHNRTILQLSMCVECENTISRFRCMQCDDLFCDSCFKDLHIRGGRRNHVATVLSVVQKIPLHIASYRLKKLKSPWVQLNDKDGFCLFYNFQVSESSRDLPLEPLNEPIEF